MPKQIVFDNDARFALEKGVDILARAVVTTLGPKGHNVALDRKWSAPRIIHDGVSVAKEIELKDPFENMGAQIIKEVAEKTVDNVGDGTTTSILLANEIIKEGMKNMGNDPLRRGANGMTLKKGIQKAIERVIQEVKRMGRTLQTNEEIRQIATISAADESLGIIIQEAIERVGKDGVIAVEESATMNVRVEYKEGMEFDKGYISPYFVTKGKQVELINPLIVLTTERVTALSEVIDFLRSVDRDANTKSLIFIASDVEGEVLATLITNTVRGTLEAVAVQAPAIAQRRNDILEDIAILTHATVISREKGKPLKSLTIEDCGRADKVIVTDHSTQIINGKGNREKIEERVKQLHTEIEKENSEFEKDKLKERLSKLTTGAAIIQVGATTVAEAEDKKERVIDAVAATRAAIEEGIVAGGGVTLYYARKVLLPLLEETTGDEKIGVEIVFNALRKPFWQLLDNANIECPNPFPVDGQTGVNLETGSMGNMFEMGITDPVKVTRIALENAGSVASMILTTACLVTDIPEEKKDK